MGIQIIEDGNAGIEKYVALAKKGCVEIGILENGQISSKTKVLMTFTEKYFQIKKYKHDAVKYLYKLKEAEV